MTAMDGVPPTDQSDLPAGFVSRLEAFIIDLIILVVGSVVAIWLIESIIRFFAIYLLWPNLSSVQFSPFVSLLIIMAYFMYFWALLGYTPGKLLLGLKIVRRDGSKLTLGRSFLRFIGYWVSAVPLFLGFIWIIFDRKRLSWHDRLAGTQVIYDRSKRLRN
ncbi:MAG: RDD family protein [Chloroflexi bacterium]|nr:MAG: RDD family protein [Chloroflexota bacterium]